MQTRREQDAKRKSRQTEKQEEIKGAKTMVVRDNGDFCMLRPPSLKMAQGKAVIGPPALTGQYYGSACMY